MSIFTLKSLQRISMLVFYSVVIYSRYNVINTIGSISNFAVKPLYADYLLIARNDVELLSEAKCIVII